jgi:prolyl-tRNA synthetase
MMGGTMAHEFMYLTSVGEDTLVLCDSCRYSANRQIAGFRKPKPPTEEPKPIEKVATPGITTIEALARFLNIPESHTAKAVFMVATMTEPDNGATRDAERFVFAVIRGDMDVNETKLSNAVNAKELRPAHPEEIVGRGAQPGYGSPLGVRDALIVVDDAVPTSPNLVAGANEEGYHYLNVNYGRDYTAEIVADIAAAQEGDACLECGSPLRLSRGVEVGNIFKLGTWYSEAMGATFLDRDGKSKPVIMGSYGIGVGRLLACVAEEHNDERGLVMPVSIAPFQAHLVQLNSPDPAVAEKANELYRQLESAGIATLYDDRPEESPGVKFADADLIGNPLRLTVSERSLRQGGVELKRRDVKETEVFPLEEAVGRVRAEIDALWEELRSQVPTLQKTT